MGKVRVFQLAKDLGMTSKELVATLQAMSIKVSSNLSSIEESEAVLVREKLSPAAPAKAPPVKKKKKAEAKVTAAPAPPVKKKEKAEAKVTAAPAPPAVKKPKVRRARPKKEKAVAKVKVAEISERQRRRKERGPKRPVIVIGEAITSDELAKKLSVKLSSLITELMDMNIMASKNQILEFEVASAIADKHDYDVKAAVTDDVLFGEEEEDAPSLLQPRPPVVTVMGHVDHGKTSLLDAIRETNVTEKEVGGITQHIGASHVDLDRGRVVFIDTPGHEAFTAMRARGAQVTDIVVLVIAADDGIKPQTVEAIDHARDAEVSIMVAVNKIDKVEANVDRVKEQLAENGFTPEDWGGATIVVPVSAKTRQGIDDLLEMVVLESEMLELKANPSRHAKGYILESRIDRGHGAVGTVLVRNGTLRIGDHFVVGMCYGRVRAMIDDWGKSATEAGPATAVEVSGFSSVPTAGDEFIVVADERKARQIAQVRADEQKRKEVVGPRTLTLEDLYARIREGDLKELRIVLKADTQGSISAVADALQDLSTDEVKLKVIHGAVGGVSESDVMLAAASDALLIGFEVRVEPKARELIEKENVDLRSYDVIYDAISDIRRAMEGLLDPEYEETVTGRAEIREVFQVSSAGAVAGCYVLEGEIVRNQEVRILRDDSVVYEGKIASLRRFKDDVRSVQSGFECGMAFEDFHDINTNDIVESLTYKEIARKLS